MAYLAPITRCLEHRRIGALIPPVRSTLLDEQELQLIPGVVKKRALHSRLTLHSMTSIIPLLSPMNLVSTSSVNMQVFVSKFANSGDVVL